MTFPAPYGGDRIAAGAQFLGRLDPGWWRQGALLPASLAGLDMADPYRCMLAWWAAQHLPARSRPGVRQAPPYDRAVRALRLSPRKAEALGFSGVDADRLTPGWQHLIACLRAPHNRQCGCGQVGHGLRLGAAPREIGGHRRHVRPVQHLELHDSVISWPAVLRRQA